ncbi:MAG TPA: glyoxalase [Candidatus Marinimicrobia bacterium]|nr:glyoxalase [Candidatus Neomarinimicrobiota bacterium]
MKLPRFHLAFPGYDLELSREFYTKILKRNPVSGDKVPARHFEVILLWKQWENLCYKFKKISLEFLIDPKIRFKEKKGEQGTFFIQDPYGNDLEFKSFKDDSMIFER